MNQYIVSVFVGFSMIKRYVAESLEVAEMLAEEIEDDIMDVSITKVQGGLNVA